jgi:excisionase family DNA binding protein
VTAPSLEHLFSAQEMATALGVSVRTLRRWIAAGRVPCRRIGRQPKFTRADYDEALARLRVPARSR